MNDKVQRYGMVHLERRGVLVSNLEADDDGEYVRHADYSRLEAECEALRADAGRYRHLRNTEWAEITYRTQFGLVRHNPNSLSSMKELDTDIDAAIASGRVT